MTEIHDNDKSRNYSRKGLIIGLSAGGVAYVLVQAVHIIHGIQQINESQKEQKFKDAHAYIIITDSTTGRKDTLRLTDYLQKKQQPADTSLKTEIIFPE
jgi:hypothetical protein